jgi:hypothetical protein
VISGDRPITGWKAFRIDKQGRLRFLFHTYEGSSLVPLDQWIETKRPWGREAQGKKYRVAFHFLRYEDDIAKFDKLTKGKYVIFPVKVMKIEPKPRTSVGSWLATHLYVSSVEFEKAVREKYAT